MLQKSAMGSRVPSTLSHSSELTPYPANEVADLTLGDLLGQQWAGVQSDYAEFYSPRSLAWLAGGIAVSATMANTPFDENVVRHKFITNVARAPSDELYNALSEPKLFGDGRLSIPTFAILALAEPWIVDLPMGPEAAEWGQRSIRTFIVGGPAVLGLQVLTGASRPGETPDDSKWNPLQDNNGVSGHSFMGAIPFMSAARMTDNPWLKGGLYAASTLPGLSRVNDDDHYFSQVLLGWWIAYLASNAVDRTHQKNPRSQFYPYPMANGVGIAFETGW